MILYTHPRDGHDLAGEERIRTGWGEGCEPGRADTPHPERFDNTLWNRYVGELYTELAQRYAKKLAGFYTDGAGPTRGRSTRMEENRQIVDYLMLRDIMKKENPELVMIQNYFGYLFSNDFAMPEGFFGCEDILEAKQWPACQKALAICPFDGGWWPQAPHDQDSRKMSARDMLWLTLFNASCTAGGGLCWASGPYCEGSLWPMGVTETLAEVGSQLHRFRDPILDAVPSHCYPTVSGDTLESRNYRFFTGSGDGLYEYLHLLKLPDSGTLLLPPTEDGAVLTSPESLTPGITVSFEAGMLTLCGTPDPIDTVIRFRRTAPTQVQDAEWINDTDKRIRYEGEWKYCHLRPTEADALGCFEADYHRAAKKGDSLFLAFEGSIVEIFCNLRPSGGAAQAYIDGVFVGRIDTRGNDAVRKRLFRSIDLHGGWHTLYLVLEENQPIELDAIRVIK